MKITLVLFLIGILLISVQAVNSAWTYQENPDANFCEGSWGGTQPCALTYDGDWDTYGWGTAGTGIVYLNYTHLSDSLNSSLWQIKDGEGVSNNLTIPQGCWDQTPLEFKVESQGGGSYHSLWYCKNSTGWELVREIQDTWLMVYEEAMWWDTPAPEDTCTPPATGNYAVTASDNCQWTENDNIPGNVTISGTGSLSLSANWTFTGNNQYIFIDGVVEFAILSGGSLNG